MPTELINPHEISLTQVLLRIACALATGLIVGFERESHGRAAGLRTTMLVCTSACLAMILSTEFFVPTAGDTWRPDPARLAAGVLTGMGFLGAGAIIREGKTVRGVTTAAVLWYVTILGLAFGAGYYTVGGLGLCIAVLALFVLPPIEGRILNDWYGVLTVTCEKDGPTDQQLRDLINATGVQVKKMDLRYNVPQARRTIRCELKYKKGDLFAVSERVIASLKDRPGIVELDWS